MKWIPFASMLPPEDVEVLACRQGYTRFEIVYWTANNSNSSGQRWHLGSTEWKSMPSFFEKGYWFLVPECSEENIDRDSEWHLGEGI